ncbi:MAG: class I SAM-dependent methyltransferase [Bryobacterales bacterium]|nr:class I SAM-dependent methyltransferase [Bryobacterales bacterium]
MSQPTPARIMQAVNAFQVSAAMKTAIDLNLFTAIGAGRRTAESLAGHCHTSVKGMRVLCDFLVVHDYLVKEDTRYGLTADSAAFLDRHSPHYFGAVASFLMGNTLQEAFGSLDKVVRKGGTLLNDEGGTVSRENPVWEEFAHSMVAMMAPAAESIAGLVNAREGAPMKVLDIAAGHGLFGITIARQNPNATVYALDWASVLEIAREHALSAGVAERWHEIEGSAFEVDLGEGYDVILITNFHHHFNRGTVESLMRKVYAALKPGGVVATLEFVPNEDRVTPKDAAGFAMVMLVTTAEGDAYTFADYDEMYRNAGFARNEIHRMEGAPEAVILSRR